MFWEMTMLYLLLPYGNIRSLIRLFYKISYIFMFRKIVRRCAFTRIRPQMSTINKTFFAPRLVNQKTFMLGEIILRFLSNLKENDPSDSFLFDYEPHGILFGSQSKGELSPRSHSIKIKRSHETVSPRV